MIKNQELIEEEVLKIKDLINNEIDTDIEYKKLLNCCTAIKNLTTSPSIKVYIDKVHTYCRLLYDKECKIPEDLQEKVKKDTILEISKIDNFIIAIDALNTRMLEEKIVEQKQHLRLVIPNKIV